MNIPPYIHQETYRGIGFHQTSKGVWVFDKLCPSGLHWCRYFKKGEAETAETMRLAIDRYHNNTPVYTGDLRYQ